MGVCGGGVGVCVHTHMQVWMPEGFRGQEYPGVGVGGSCKLPCKY